VPRCNARSLLQCSGSFIGVQLGIGLVNWGPNNPFYVRDSGLLHALLGVRTEKELLAHPKSSASWEGLWFSGSRALATDRESTVRRYLDLFTKLLVVRQLQPWHENLAGQKRIVRPASAR
jgi:hypothetical protein